MIKKKARISSIILSSVMIAIIGYLAFSVLDDSQEITVTENEQAFDLEFNNGTETVEDCSIMLDDGSCFSITANSVLPKQVKITESNEDAVNSFLGLSSQFDQFGVEIVATKYNVNGESHSSSSVLPVNFITNNIVDKNSGFIIDNVQVNFNALSKAKYSSFNLDGDVDFLLDGKLIANKKLWVSGSLANENILPIKVVNKVPPPIDDRPETFDFTFTDEGFIDGSEHTFRVVLKSIKGTHTANGVQNQFDWNGEFIAYELNLVVDESNTFVINEEGKTITVPKKDSAVIACGQGEWTASLTFTSNKNTQKFTRTVPSRTTDVVKIFSQDKSELIGEIAKFKAEAGKTDCKKFVGLERSSQYIINVLGGDYPITTTKEQQNIVINWVSVPDTKYVRLSVTCSQYSDPTHCASGAVVTYSLKDPQDPIYTKATSSFGLNWTDLP